MIAEYERAQIAERCRRGKLHRARGGAVSVMARAPYGYRYVKRSEHADAFFEIDEAEAPVVREIFRRYARGRRVDRPRSHAGSQRRACRPGPARRAGTTRRSGGCSATRPTPGRPPTARRTRPAQPVRETRHARQRGQRSAHIAREERRTPQEWKTDRGARARDRGAVRARPGAPAPQQPLLAAQHAAARRCCKGSSSAASAATRTTAARRAARTGTCASTTAARAPTATAAPKDASARTGPCAWRRSTSSSGPGCSGCSTTRH